MDTIGGCFGEMERRTKKLGGWINLQAKISTWEPSGHYVRVYCLILSPVKHHTDLDMMNRAENRGMPHLIRKTSQASEFHQDVTNAYRKAYTVDKEAAGEKRLSHMTRIKESERKKKMM